MDWKPIFFALFSPMHLLIQTAMKHLFYVLHIYLERKLFKI